MMATGTVPSGTDEDEEDEIDMAGSLSTALAHLDTTRRATS
jgi:hypothetical protein